MIQQTLEGSVYFEDEQGRQRAGIDRALLFSYPETSRYGLDKNCRIPYRLRWTFLTGDQGFLAIASEIRENFGSILKMSRKGEAGQLLQHLQNDFDQGSSRDRFYYAESAYRLLLAVYREQVNDSRGKDPISFGKYMLETQFRSPRNLKEWADDIGISREHFTREFHKRYEETPATFLRRLRLDHARILLRNPSLTLPDVAKASGFASAHTFYRAYKLYFGEAAGQHR